MSSTFLGNRWLLNYLAMKCLCHLGNEVFVFVNIVLFKAQFMVHALMCLVMVKYRSTLPKSLGSISEQSFFPRSDEIYLIALIILNFN